MPFPRERPRRLRRTAALRRMARETRLAPADLVHPAFVREDINAARDISSLPGHRHETADSLCDTVDEVLRLGCAGLLLFGLPADKDAEGSGAWAEDGVVQTAIRSVRRRFGDDCVIVADCCLCEYTDHGHCGLID